MWLSWRNKASRCVWVRIAMTVACETVVFRKDASCTPKSTIMQNCTLRCEKTWLSRVRCYCVKRKTTQPDIFGTENYTPVKYIYSTFSKKLNPFLKICLFLFHKSTECLFIAWFLTQCTRRTLVFTALIIPLR